MPMHFATNVCFLDLALKSGLKCRRGLITNETETTIYPSEWAYDPTIMGSTASIYGLNSGAL